MIYANRSILLKTLLVFALIETCASCSYGYFMPIKNTQKRRRLTADDRKLIRRIRVLRKQRDLTQERLSEAIGRNPNFMASVESFKRGLSLPTLQRISKVFGVKLKELFDDKS